MKVVVAGGSGWIGTALVRSLIADGHEVVILSRSTRGGRTSSPTRQVTWDGRSIGPWADELGGADAVVNLSGKSVADGRWNEQRKRELWTSRTESTATLVGAIERAKVRPPILVNASAVGYYGDRGDRVATEADPPGDDFLARLVVDWERTALEAERSGIRVCLMRTGIVFGRVGSVLDKLSLPFRFFVGGHIGSGQQWVSWVHIDDVVGLYRFAIERTDASGPINVTAPEPVTNKRLSQTLGAVLGRPSWMPVPGFAVRLAVGEIAEQILTGQRVMPSVAERLGYIFQHPTLVGALRSSLARAA